MAVNLKLGDRLAIIKDGVKKGYTPQEAMLQYQINKDGGYNNWKNQFKLTTGINPDLDDTYNYELFFKENPEAAKLLILGEVSPEILQMYKTPLAIQREKQVLQQRQKGNVNSLMDYAQYEKLINDYMNKSVNVSSCGGPVSINMYAEGTDNLNEKRTDITKFGTLESEYKDTRTPNFIDITPEELQNFINDSGRTITIDIPKDNLEGVPEEYKNLPKTRFIRIPYKFLKDRNYNVDDLKEDEAITYYLLDFNENDEYGNPKKYYTIRKVNKHTPVGRAYDYWKRDQRLGNVLNSDWLYKDDKNIKEGPVDINNTVLLSDVTVTPENNRQFESDTAIPGEYNQQEKYIDPFNIGGTELNVPNNALYNTQGTKGGSFFGTSTDGLRMPDIFNMNMLDLYTDFQYTPYLWQLEDLEYLNPPGYVPIPNWNVALVYDTGAEGADFADFMKMLAGYGRDNSLRDELMAKLFEPKDYFADPYAGSHYTDTQSFYDAYDNNPYNRIQRESNGIPLYAKGGLLNLFGDGSYIPQGYERYVYEPKTINGIEYAKLPKSYTNTDIKVSNLEGKTTDDYEYVFVRKDPKTNRYLNTQYDRDISNINTYRSGKLPELITWDKNAPAASAYDANNPLIQSNIESLHRQDPFTVSQINWRRNKQDLDRKWFTNEDATKFLLTTAGLGALGAGIVSAPLTTTLGFAGSYAGGKAVDKGMQLGTNKTWGEWMSGKTGLPEWFSEFTNPGAIVGGGVAGFGYSKLANAYTNPSSLLNRNIRAEIYNRKFPFTYDMMDKANYTPFYHAAKATLKGKTIKPRSLAQRTYEMLETSLQKNNENSPLRTPFIGESIADYVARPVRAKYPQAAASKYRNDLAAISNRAKAFSKYLGLDINDSEPLFLFDKNKTYSNYVKQSDGTYTVPGISKSGIQFVNDMMPIRKGPNKGEFIRPDGSFVTRDNVIRNHGGVSGKVVKAPDGGVELQMEDIFDLQPLESVKWLPKFIRNIEVSDLIPGAKPFTVKFSTHNSHMTPEEFINAKNKYKLTDKELDRYYYIMRYIGKK